MKKVVLLTTKTCTKCASIKKELSESPNDSVEVVDAMSEPWLSFVRNNEIKVVPTVLVYDNDNLLVIDASVRSLSGIIKLLGN